MLPSKLGKEKKSPSARASRLQRRGSKQKSGVPSTLVDHLKRSAAALMFPVWRRRYVWYWRVTAELSRTVHSKLVAWYAFQRFDRPRDARHLSEVSFCHRLHFRVECLDFLVSRPALLCPKRLPPQLRRRSLRRLNVSFVALLTQRCGR